MGFKFDDQLYHVAGTFWAFNNAKNREGGWAFQFGPYGSTRVIVLSEPGTSHLEDALEAAAEVVKDVAPGLFVSDEELKDLYEEAKAEGLDDDEAMEQAEADLTYTESGYLASYEWYVNDLYADDPLYVAAVIAAIVDSPDSVDAGDKEVREVLTRIGASKDQINKVFSVLPPEE